MLYAFGAILSCSLLASLKPSFSLTSKTSGASARFFTIVTGMVATSIGSGTIFHLHPVRRDLSKSLPNGPSGANGILKTEQAR